LPLLPKLWRRGWWLWLESLVPVFTRPDGRAARATKPIYVALSQLNRFIQLRGDRRLWKATTPDHPVGCKRILLTADWFPMLRRPNVALVTDRIAEITEAGLVTESGARHEVDAIIFGTGFTATDFLAPMEVNGRGGRSLARDAWARGGEAYLGIAVPDFPNMFLLYGPNTNHGTGSALELLEAQAGYAAQAVGLLASGAAEQLEVRREVHDAFQAEMAARLADSVWVGCSSWYVNAHGRITNNWPGSQTEYRRRTRRVDLGDYVTRVPEPARPAA
jgi:cation diffusion facilitator CzcD-associated flavoprotein CzcO